MGEYSENNVGLEATSVSSFFANYGYHLYIQTDLSPAEGAEVTQVRTLVRTLQEHQDVYKLEMPQAQEYKE